MNGTPWTPAETAELMRLCEAGTSNNDIAAVLGKTPHAVRQRLSRLKLSNPRKLRWTEERTALLARLWKDGWSGHQAALELGGVTRNAVIGKVHRMGLPWRETNTAHVKKAAPRPAKDKPTSPRCFQVPHPVPPGAKPAPGSVTLLDLRDHHCRWPLGDPRHPDFRFCGGPADLAAGHPYCQHHDRIAYREPFRREALL